MKSATTTAAVVVAVAASAAVFWPIVNVGFFADDWVHFYDIVNEGPGRFWVKNFIGHLQLTRNAIFLLHHALFGLHPAPYMGWVLVTHLLNVALLVLLVARLTGNAAVAALVAMLWGTSPFHVDVLGWYSVYGQVLAATCALWLLWQVARVAAAGGGRTERMPWSWPVAMLLASTSFGSGWAIALAMPAVAWLVFPEKRQRPLVLGVAASAVLCAALYVLVDLLNTSMFETPSAIWMGPSDGRTVARLVELVARLLAAATATWIPAAFTAAPPAGQGAWLALSAYVAVLALGITRMDARERRWTLASVLLSLSAYTMIALGRAALLSKVEQSITLGARYHYAPVLGMGLALALALAAIWRSVRRYRPVGGVIYAGWIAALLAGRVWNAAPIPRFDDQQRTVDDVLAHVRTAVDAAPPGADVFIANRDFMYSYRLSMQVGHADFPLRYPGWAAIFAIYHPSDVVDGRRVYFVVDDPAKVAAWQRGRRGAALIVSPEAMRSRGGQLSE